jgi:peptidyl-prolyl cis-trans isomerase D
MLGFFRSWLNTWLAKLFFFVLVLCFGVWGIGDVIRTAILGGDTASIATVGSTKIEVPEAQGVYRQQLQRLTQMFGGKIDPTPEIKRGVAGQTIEQLVTQAALQNFAKAQGLMVSDDALRQVVWGIRQFQGPDGQFNRPIFEGQLRNNGLTEAYFLQLMRGDITKAQLLEAVGAGLAPPESEAREMFAFQRETRVAEAVEFPFASAAAPPAPTDAQLQRWYDNHPESYQTAETRRIKAVVLAPETVAADIPISEDDIKAAYEAHRGDFDKPEKRSAQIVQAPDEAKAKDLAAKWRAGADWAAMQAAAQAQGGSAIELNDTSRIELPAAELGAAVFAAAPDAITDPVKSPLAWHVIKVTKVTPAVHRTLADMHDEIRNRLLADRAVNVMDDDANKIEELFAAGTTLDGKLSGLGLAPIEGTLDAAGNTPDGHPAPIPGPTELRQALLQAVFAAKKDDPLRLIQAPNSASGEQSYFAFTVEEIDPPKAKRYAEVAEEVKADWTKDAIHHEQDEAAAKLLTAVQGGQSLEDAATVAGVQVRRLPAVGRSEPVEGVPASLVKPLFGMKKGEATMVETPDGFMVAMLAEIVQADPAKDPVGYGRMKDSFAKQLTQDIETTFATAVRDRQHPRINPAAIDNLAQTN